MAKSHPLDWLVEPLVEDPGYIRRPMFGCIACYFRGKMVAVLAAREEPWNGLLVPVERDQHEAILGDFSALVPHPILPKWLYLSESHEDFESIAQEIIECVRLGDPRFGVVPSPKKKSSRKN
jgi:hypothetical protein